MCVVIYFSKLKNMFYQLILEFPFKKIIKVRPITLPHLHQHFKQYKFTDNISTYTKESEIIFRKLEYDYLNAQLCYISILKLN